MLAQLCGLVVLSTGVAASGGAKVLPIDIRAPDVIVGDGKSAVPLALLFTGTSQAEFSGLVQNASVHVEATAGSLGTVDLVEDTLVVRYTPPHVGGQTQAWIRVEAAIGIRKFAGRAELKIAPPAPAVPSVYSDGELPDRSPRPARARQGQLGHDCL